METRLVPIETPRGIVQRIMFAFSRRMFGKVITPIKVVYTRMPLKFTTWSGKISQLDRKVSLPFMTVMLIREKVAHVNVCTFCTDIGRSIVIRQSMNEEKFEALENYASSPLFTEAEKALLRFTEEMSLHKKASDQTFKALLPHYNERQICEIAWIIATEHFYNIMNLSLNIHSDMLCDIARKK